MFLVPKSDESEDPGVATFQPSTSKVRRDGQFRHLPRFSSDGHVIANMEDLRPYLSLSDTRSSTHSAWSTRSAEPDSNPKQLAAGSTPTSFRSGRGKSSEPGCSMACRTRTPVSQAGPAGMRRRGPAPDSACRSIRVDRACGLFHKSARPNNSIPTTRRTTAD